MTSSTGIHLSHIGIGSNLAQPLAQAQRAVTALAGIPHTKLLTVSPWYRSTPVGGPPGQPDYINGVAVVRTALVPHALLDALQTLELAQGRERKERWGARTLDLDILLYDDALLDDERLTVPHPRMAERAFVLVPLADVCPPDTLVNGERLGSLLSALPQSEADRGLWRLEPDHQ